MNEIKNLYLALGNVVKVMDSLSIEELKKVKNATETVRVFLMDLIMRKEE